MHRLGGVKPARVLDWQAEPRTFKIEADAHDHGGNSIVLEDGLVVHPAAIVILSQLRRRQISRALATVEPSSFQVQHRR